MALASTEPIVNRDKSNGNLRPWKPGQSGNPKGRKPIAPEVREMLESAVPEVVQQLIDAALNKGGEVPWRFRQTAQLAVLDRVYGKPEAKVKVSGRVDFAHLLAEFTEQHKAIEGQCEVLDATPIATHGTGEDEKPNDNNDVHD